MIWSALHNIRAFSSLNLCENIPKMNFKNYAENWQQTFFFHRNLFQHKLWN